MNLMQNVRKAFRNRVDAQDALPDMCTYLYTLHDTVDDFAERVKAALEELEIRVHDAKSEKEVIDFVEDAKHEYRVYLRDMLEVLDKAMPI